MQNLNDIKIGTLSKDGSVTYPANIKWTEADCDHLVSQKFNNGEWDYFFVIRITNLEDACGEEGFMVDIQAASSEAAGKEHVARAIESCGIEDTSSLDDQAVAVILCDYGVSATLWSEVHPTEEEAVAIAKHEAERVQMLFGFYMDRPLNRIGSTGWDFVSGDIMGGLKKVCA